MRRSAVILVLLAVLTLGPAVAACSGDDVASPEDGRLVIATTVSPITSIVANIVGDRADITGIVPEGTDSHTFEPRPSVAELLSKADLVFANGLQLEAPTLELARANVGDHAEIVELGTRTVPEDEWIYDASFPEADGQPNPHLWITPGFVDRFARLVAEVLVRHDGANAAHYEANLAAFLDKVTELHQAMEVAFATIPDRRLLTYHDAYPYLARSYGFDVVGAIQMSDAEEPTPSEVAELIEQVRRERVPVVFGSEVFPSPVLEQIARETDARYVDDLRDDDLPGEPGDPHHSWLGLLRFDFITITEALGGNASALRAVTVRDVAPDRAHYPK